MPRRPLHRLIFLLAASCATAPRPGSLLATSGDPTPAGPCEPSPERPPLDPRFAPTLSGRVALVAATGEARLSSVDHALVTWSDDGQVFAHAEQDVITLVRSTDGALLDVIRCPGIPFYNDRVAISDDLRWLAVPVQQRTGDQRRELTCIADRPFHQVRLIEGATQQARFVGGALVGTGRSIDLATGQVTPLAAPPSPPISTEHIDTQGADQFAISHNGRYLVGWSVLGVLETAASGEKFLQPFVAVWDRATGRLLWRANIECCSQPRFSPDDRFIARDGYPGNELLRVDTGEVIAFPGPLGPFAPDGQRILVYGAHSLEVWSIDPFGPQRPLLVVPRPRTVVARSRDGTARATVERDTLFLERATVERDMLFLERAGSCAALRMGLDGRTAIAFSPDGRELYAGTDGSMNPPGAVLRNGSFHQTVASSASVWQTATGTRTRSISVLDVARIVPMPSLGQVWFLVEGGVWIYDTRSGGLLKVAQPPRLSYGPPDAHGRQLATHTARGTLDNLWYPVAGFADGMHVAGASPAAAISIWDLQDPLRVLDLPPPPNHSAQEVLAIAPDERHLAVGMDNGAIAVWTRDGRTVPMTTLHPAPVHLLAFSPDGRTLASASKDGTVILSDVATGAPRATIALTLDRATLLWWSPDGAQLTIDTARRFQIVVAPQR